jgi:CBS domain-containing protein
MVKPTAIERFDAFPYRYRLAEIVTRPVVSAPAETNLAAAATRMLEDKVGSVLVLDADGRPDAIFTEHDLLAAIARHGHAVLEQRLGNHSSRPVETLPSDAFVHSAIGRMDRLGIRHIVVVEPDSGRAIGVVSARGLLKQRAGMVPAIGDAVAVATSAADLGAIHAQLPALALRLLDEGVEVRRIAALISSVVCAISGRAAALAARAVESERGPAPASWCYLVLGSGGRGESQLIPDQDNALVHDGTDADDAWFAALGAIASDIIDQAGIPYCKGKVMASNPAWRGSLEAWRWRIDGWVETPSPDDLLSVDIFYDFQPVHGDRALASALREHARRAATSRPFLVVLSRELADNSFAIGFFGNLKTERGRLDLKRAGLLPIVAGARVLALSLGSAATSTVDRLAAARDAGIIQPHDAETLEEAQTLFLHHIVEQQGLDIAAGRAPTVSVDVKRLSVRERRRLKAALRDVGMVSRLVEDALTARP